jgi:hypothetical protein
MHWPLELHAAKMRARSTSLNMKRAALNRGRYKVNRKRGPAEIHATPWPVRRAEYLREVGRDMILRKEA